MKFRINHLQPGVLGFGDHTPVKDMRRSPVVYLVVAGTQASRLSEVTSMRDIEQRVGMPANIPIPRDFRDMQTNAHFEEFGRLNVLAAMQACFNVNIRLRLLVVQSDSQFLRLPYLESMAALSNKLGLEIRDRFPNDYLVWRKEHDAELAQHELDVGSVQLKLKNVYNALQDFDKDLIIETGIGKPEFNGLSAISSVTFTSEENVSIGTMIGNVRAALDFYDHNKHEENGDLCYLGQDPITINLIRSFSVMNSDQVINEKNEEAEREQSQSED